MHSRESVFLLFFESIQIIPHFLHVFPDLPFFARIPQEVGRMKCGHHLNTAKFFEISAQFGNAGCRFKQVLSRRISEYDDHFRPNGSDFPKQKGLADRRLFQCRLAVAGGAAAVNVPDENIPAFEADRLKYFCKQFAGPSNKRLALYIFIRPGRSPTIIKSAVSFPTLFTT